MCMPTKTKGDAATTPVKDSSAKALEPEDAWLKDLDFEAFTAECKALGQTLEAEQGPADVAHLEKMIRWSNMCAAIGLLSMGFSVNVITVMALSLYTFSRWTMIAHHTCHGGYEKCASKRFSRFRFGLGGLWRRFNDWFDWMMPEAWNVEHNNRHHYHLSEKDDPDLVEENLSELRGMNVPMWAKYMAIPIIMGTWKWFYYAPNTYKELKLAQWRREGKEIPKGVNPHDAITLKGLFSGTSTTAFYSITELFLVVLGPYFLIHFFITPLPLLWLGEHLDGYTGEQMYWTAIKNLFLAEILTNAHGFLAVVTNHAGDDMYRFERGCRPFSGSFFLRQVLASADYQYGSDTVDFLHGWLSYQVEHHMWPNLSMLSYQKAGPLVRKICEKHGVPYVQESVFIRLKKTVDIMVGKTNMRRFPDDYELLFLEKDAEILAQK